MSDSYYTALLADDEPSITEGLSSLDIWENLGIKIIATADTGAKALELIRSLKPDFAIIDIMMPALTGLEVLEKIEKASSGTDIIILSGYDKFEYARTALKFRAKGYLLKPVDKNELEETLRELVTKKKGGSGSEIKLSRSFLNDFADGRVLDSTSAVSTITTSPMGLPEGPCFAMIITFSDGIAEGSLKLMQQELKGISSVMWHKDAKTIEAMFSAGDSIPFETAEKCIKCLERENMILPRIAIGNIVPRIAELPVSFSRASQALMYQMYDESGRIFSSEIIAQSPPTYKPEDKDAEILSEYILKNDKERIKEFCSSFISKLLGKSLPPPNYVYSITNWLIMKTSSQLRLLLEGSEMIPDAPNITKYRTIQSLEEGLVSLFCRISSYIDAVYGEKKARAILNEKEEEDQIIKTMCSYVESHAEEQIRLEDIAECVNLSPSYAAIYFRKKRGETLREYMLEKKMEEARKLLVKKDASVTEIAYDLGYHDYRSFSRAFKNITGLTPSEFQERYAL